MMGHLDDSRLDVDVALCEILHFLKNDERLPGRTRKAVQFLHVRLSHLAPSTACAPLRHPLLAPLQPPSPPPPLLSRSSRAPPIDGLHLQTRRSPLPYPAQGLREQMVQHDTQKSSPELFDCPLTRRKVSDYTFREVRQRYGEQFREQFWPVFQAFNCVLPARQPEETAAKDAAAEKAAIASFIPITKK
jgi:hypothetical protein